MPNGGLASTRLKWIHVRSIHQQNVHVHEHAQSYVDPFPTRQRLCCHRENHRCPKNHGVHDDLDKANGHADIGDPGDDGGDREGGSGLRDPEPEDSDKEGAESNVDDQDDPQDGISHNYVSDRVKGRRVNQLWIHHHMDPSADHTTRRHIRHKMEIQEGLFDLRMEVGGAVRRDADLAYLFGDRPAGDEGLIDHRYDIPRGVPCTAS